MLVAPSRKSIVVVRVRNAPRADHAHPEVPAPRADLASHVHHAVPAPHVDLASHAGPAPRVDLASHVPLADLASHVPLADHGPLADLAPPAAPAAGVASVASATVSGPTAAGGPGTDAISGWPPAMHASGTASTAITRKSN